MKKIAVMVGTRPEAIKLAPVIKALKRHPDFSCTLISTGQHKEMLDTAFADFDLVPDIDLAVMVENQTLTKLTSRLLSAIDTAMDALKPDWLIVQGDTTTVLAATLCAFFRRIPVAHVEAGLRSFDFEAPFPEEMNRKIASLGAKLHFSPTAGAATNLIEEGIPENTIIVTGNTGIDALLQTSESLKSRPEPLPADVESFTEKYSRFVLVTGHRRENFGEGFMNICAALQELAQRHPDVGFIYPVHLNPLVQQPVRKALSNLENVLLTEPLSYKRFVTIMNISYLILTDSGGIQEEAPSLGKPVLIMRDVTERPEGIAAGCATLVGASQVNIVRETSRLLTDDFAYQEMSNAQNPYGDGNASEMIVNSLLNCEPV